MTSCASGAAKPGITAEYRTRWHHLDGIAALFGLAAFLLCLSTVL